MPRSEIDNLALSEALKIREMIAKRERGESDANEN